MFISTDQTKFAKACTAVMFFVASAMLPVAASTVRAVVTEAGADPTGKTDSTLAIQKCIDRVSAAGGGENGADVIELRRWRLLVEVLGDLPLMLDVEAAIKGEIPS